MVLSRGGDRRNGCCLDVTESAWRGTAAASVIVNFFFFFGGGLATLLKRTNTVSHSISPHTGQVYAKLSRLLILE